MLDDRAMTDIDINPLAQEDLNWCTGNWEVLQRSWAGYRVPSQEEPGAHLAKAPHSTKAKVCWSLELLGGLSLNLSLCHA